MQKLKYHHKPTNRLCEIILDDHVYQIVKKHKLGIFGQGKTWYVRVGIADHWIPLHKLVCPSPKGYYTDHINRNTFDNREENLRIVTPTNSALNRGYAPNGERLKTSKFRGVRKFKDRIRQWGAAIKKGNDRYYLGSFYTELEAALAYDKKAKELFGEYAQLNFKNLE